MIIAIKVLATILVCTSLILSFVKNPIIIDYMFDVKDPKHKWAMIATFIWSIIWRAYVISAFWLF